MSRRTRRVADLLRQELALVIQRDVADPRAQLVTVSRVELSPDLRHARVGLSVLGDDEEREASAAAVRHAGGYIRRQLGRRLRLKVTPELVFELDRGAEHSQRIADLLEGLDRDDEST